MGSDSIAVVILQLVGIGTLLLALSRLFGGTKGRSGKRGQR
ncbi:hypothetical protein [Cohnella xylanilytica]|nr:hypothetical protein [Cohnella xylanilytica]